MTEKDIVKPTLHNPLDPKRVAAAATSDTDLGTDSGADAGGVYEAALREGQQLRELPRKTAGLVHIGRQHAKGRMTVWERMDMLRDPGSDPTILYQNWGPNLDGASLVTAVIKIQGRDVALYGHDFTVRAGSMDATNGTKLANLFRLAGKERIPLIGMNDSAGAFVPAGIGGLDGYSEAFTALRKISGVVPSIMCMFGYNAGGGSYLPRQGSFMIQPNNTFFGLTGPGVVKSVLGEDITADELGGPGVHGQSGVTDLTVNDEVGALRTAQRLLNYLPSGNHHLAPYQTTSDPLDRPTGAIDTLLLLLALVTVAAYLEYSRHTEAYGVAENTVLSSPDIQVVLGADRGDELRLGYFFRGQARGRGSSAQGRFLFRVLGPSGEGSALVHLNHHRGRWQAVQVDFLDSRGRTRSLEVQKPKSRPPRPVAAPPSAPKAVDGGTDSAQVPEEIPSL